MNHLKAAAAVTLAMTGAAHAAGIERSALSVNALFEEGEYLELGFRTVMPNASGIGGPDSFTPGVASGDLLDDYVAFGAAYKGDINEKISYAIIFDQPVGANVTYPVSNYFATGTTAELKSNSFSGIVQYNFDTGMSIYGGLRLQSMEADARIPFLGGYSVAGKADWSFGYLAGIAYERPEIAARVALTYHSGIDHTLDSSESFGGPAAATETELDTPQSVNLEFQTGLNPKTLLFGSLRWVEWSSFEIAPPEFFSVFNNSITDYQDDWITYRLGIGRKLNDSWSLLGLIGYEAPSNTPTGNLAPYDGLLRYTLGAVYTRDKLKVTGGVTYVNLGDANSELGPIFPAGVFRNNDALAVGVRFGWSL